MAANALVTCPHCGQQRTANEVFCGYCGTRLRAAPVPPPAAAPPQSYARLGAQPAPVPAPAPALAPQPNPNVLPQQPLIAARPRLLGLWTRPVGSRDWMIFATQLLVPLGFLLVVLAAVLGWGEKSIYSVLSVALALLMVLVWVAALALPRARLPKNWQLAAAGCLAVPGLIIVATAAIVVIQPILTELSNAGVPLLACLGGLLPLGAVVYLLNRK